METFYETLWLYKFLNPANLPQEMKDYLDRELCLLLEKVKKNSNLVDFGCGLGRHLGMLRYRLNYGLGLDIISNYVEHAKIAFPFQNLEFKVSDAKDTQLDDKVFDYAICMNNTIGNIDEPEKVVKEMRRVLKPNGTILVSVYSPMSINVRKKWYENTGLKIIDISAEGITAKDSETNNLFKSNHFSEEQLRALFGDCKISDIAGLGYLVELVVSQFKTNAPLSAQHLFLLSKL